MTSSQLQPFLGSIASITADNQRPMITSNTQGNLHTCFQCNMLSLIIIIFIGRLPLMKHYQSTSELCRYTVNLPKGQMSNDVIEVKIDDHNEEYLEVTCGDKPALLYITRLCRGSKGLFLFR